MYNMMTMVNTAVWCIRIDHDGSDRKETAYNVGDLCLLPGLGRSPGRGHDNPVQYSYLENLMDRGAWWATIHRVTKSQIWLRWLSMHTHFCLTFVVFPIWKDSILSLLFPLIPCLISWTSYTLTYLLHIPYPFFTFIPDPSDLCLPGLPSWVSGKEPACLRRRHRKPGFDS